MAFTRRHHNRLTMPDRHVLVVEDVLPNQRDLLYHLGTLYEPEGRVQVSVVPGGVYAAAILGACRGACSAHGPLLPPIELVVLDHDLPDGNGSDLLLWMRREKIDVRVLGASGIPQNNVRMLELGATWAFTKAQIMAGEADAILREVGRDG